MTDTYSIICSKDASSNSICQENKLGAVGPDGYGKKLNGSIIVIADNTQNGIRRVYIRRNISINDLNYFSFPTWTQEIEMIYAIGNGQTFTAETTSMGPGGSAKLLIANRLSNNVTVSATNLGSDIVLNSITVYPDQNIMQLNMSGPDSVYFGIGFNSSVMKGAYTIMCDAVGCYENYMNGHSYGTLLNNTLSVVSVTKTNGIKTVVINRKQNISSANSGYFTFPDSTTAVPIIYAIGQNNSWSSSDAMSFNASTYGSVNLRFVTSQSTESIVMAKQVLFADVHQSVDIQVHPSRYRSEFFLYFSQSDLLNI